MYTTADALTEALVDSGVKYVFLNSGTDYPDLIESWAKFRALGEDLPEIITCPHEMVAFCAAQGYAQATGVPAGVFVHVDVGTQNIGGSIHNAYRGRVPVLLLAGLSPYTIEGERSGSRDNYIQFVQNVTDQVSIVREYIKHYNEIRSGDNVAQLIKRAVQLSRSQTPGPVYLTVAREVLEAPAGEAGGAAHAADKADSMHAGYGTVAPLAIEEGTLSKIADALVSAKNPLIITSYLGMDTAAPEELAKLCGLLAVPVVDSAPSYVNLSAENPMHLGTNVVSALAESDLVLAIDCDVPWLPAKTSMPKGCRMIVIDQDPIKEEIPLWHFPAELFVRADGAVALRQLYEKVSAHKEFDAKAIEARRVRIAAAREARLDKLAEAAKLPAAGTAGLTVPYLLSCLKKYLKEDTVILNESITNTNLVEEYLPRTLPGTRFHSGGAALGWNGGAAIGVKLAYPERDVVSVTGDGSYLFSCPSIVHWVSRRYETPFLTIVLNNGGWTAPRFATSEKHPDGFAARIGEYFTSFDPSPAYDKIAEAAGGALAITVEEAGALDAALKAGFDAIHSGRSAALNVILARR